MANSIEEVEDILKDVTAEKGGGKFVMAHVKDDPANDARIKAFKASVRGTPLVDEYDGSGKCILTGETVESAVGDPQRRTETMEPRWGGPPISLPSVSRHPRGPPDQRHANKVVLLAGLVVSLRSTGRRASRAGRRERTKGSVSGAACGRRGGNRAKSEFSGEHEPRNPHAHERRAGHDGDPAGYSSSTAIRGIWRRPFSQEFRRSPARDP